MRTSLILTLSIALGAASTAGADAYSLEQAVAYARDHNLDLQAAREQTNAATAATGIARGARLPQLGARYLQRRSDNPLDAFADKLNTRSVNPALDFSSPALNYPDPSTVHATELALQLPVYTGGRLAASVREAKDNEQSADLRSARTGEIVAFQTRQAYFAAQAAAQGRAIADDAVEAAREHAQTTGRLVREGRIVVSDRMTAELNLAAAESAREQALNRERRSLDELKLVMGLPLDSPLEIEGWKRITVDTPPADTAASEQRALAQRKDLLAGQSQVSAGRARIDQARAAFLPQISLVAANSWYDRSASLDNKSTSVMGVVSMNLFSGGSSRQQVAAARTQVKESEIRLRSQERMVRNEVRSAHDNLREALARHAIAAENTDKARETVRLVKKRYGEGRTILIDVLMAERVLVESRNEELASSYHVAVSRAALQLAEGAPDQP